MNETLERIQAQVRRFHRDEDGAEMVEKLLIIAVIVLPLLLVLIIFRNKIKELVWDSWQDVEGESDWDAGP